MEFAVAIKTSQVPPDYKRESCDTGIFQRARYEPVPVQVFRRLLCLFSDVELVNEILKIDFVR